MKNFKTKTKYIFILLALSVSVVTVHAAFTGPGTVLPPETIPGFTTPLMSDKSEAVISPYIPNLNFPGRTFSLMNSNIAALVTDGIFSFGPVRAMGKLTASLIPTTLTGYPGREVMTIFNGRNSAVVSFLTNTPYLGFWSQEEYTAGTTGTDALSQLDANIKKITNLLFGRVNIKSLVVSPSNPYETTNKNLALYGTTNLGKGNSCYIPLPSYGSSATYASQLAELYKCPDGYFMKAGGTDNSMVQVCQEINPSSAPSFMGACPGIIEVIIDPNHLPIDNSELGELYGYNPWYGAGPSIYGLHPPEGQIINTQSNNYALRYNEVPTGGGPPPLYNQNGFYTDFDFSTPIIQDETFDVTYVINVPAYSFTTIPQPGSVPASAVNVPQTMTIPAQNFTLTGTVTKHVNGIGDETTTFLGNPVPGYVAASRTTINNFINSFNGPPPSNPNILLVSNDSGILDVRTLKTKGFLGTRIAHALPNIPPYSISVPLEYWFREKMTVVKQCIVPHNPNIAIRPGLNFNCSTSGTGTIGTVGSGGSGGGGN